MDLPISFQNVGGIAVLLLIMGLLVWMHLRRPRSVMVAPKGASLGLAYEWSLTPLNDAKNDLRARFPELDRVVAEEAALYGEALKTERYNESEPAVDGHIVTLPVQRMNPKSTLIFNFISRGGVGTLVVRGKTDEHGAIKRVG